MTRLLRVTRQELEGRRREILAGLGTTYDELAKRAASRSLIGDEWAAWEELHEIEFLLGNNDRHAR